jgi:hypothetical protein
VGEGIFPPPYNQLKRGAVKILHLGHHCCIRMSKECIALSEKTKHEIHGAGTRSPLCIDHLKSFFTFVTISQLKNYIKGVDFDIIHIHNEPNWLVYIVKELRPDIKVILDVHDSMTYRSQQVKHFSNAEEIAFDLADGFVFVGDKCCEISLEKNKNQISGKRYCVLPSYVNERYIKYKDWSRTGGLVYEGGTMMKNRHPEWMMYADYKKLSDSLKEKGVPFYLYTTGMDKEKQEYYKNAILAGSLQYDKMISTMGHHDWGLTGNVDKFMNWDVAMPNKLFEYMAGGIPVIAMNAKEVGKFVQKHGVGISVSSVEELMDRWEERYSCRKNVFLKRNQFTMEQNIHILEKLYLGVI